MHNHTKIPKYKDKFVIPEKCRRHYICDDGNAQCTFPSPDSPIPPDCCSKRVYKEVFARISGHTCCNGLFRRRRIFLKIPSSPKQALPPRKNPEIAFMKNWKIKQLNFVKFYEFGFVSETNPANSGRLISKFVFVRLQECLSCDWEIEFCHTVVNLLAFC